MMINTRVAKHACSLTLARFTYVSVGCFTDGEFYKLNYQKLCCQLNNRYLMIKF